MKTVLAVVFIIAISCLALSASAALTDNLAGYWSFDVNASDNYGSNHGTGYGGVTHITSGQRLGAGAYSFDGSDDYIAVPNSASFNFSGNFTFAYWFNTSYAGGYPFNKYGGSPLRGFEVYGSGKVDLYAPYSSNWVQLTGSSHADSGWHYLLVKREGTTVSKYVDDVLESSNTLSGDMTSTANLCIGGECGSAFVPGKIDEVGIWTRGLTSTEMTQLYNSGSGFNPLSGQNGVLPNSSTFSVSLGTTNFSAVADLSNVSAMTLATSNGKIKWKQGVNVSRADLDSNVKIGTSFVSLNVIGLHSTLNATANVTLSGLDCANFNLYYATGFYTDAASLIAAGTLVATQADLGGDCTDNTKCKYLSCSGGELMFEAQHFDGFGGGEGSAPVPEFGTWLMLVLALGIVGVGLMRLRK